MVFTKTSMANSSIAAKKSCAPVRFVHRDIKGAVVTEREWADAWRYLHQTLADRSIYRYWPTEGWRLTMDGLRCKHCGETNVKNKKAMVEQDERGVIFCSACGKESK